VIDPARLAETGALAGNLQGDLLILQPARDSARAWRGGGAVASVLVITPRKARLVTNLPP
jgi:hypothetical protein